MESPCCMVANKLAHLLGAALVVRDAGAGVRWRHGHAEVLNGGKAHKVTS